MSAAATAGPARPAIAYQVVAGMVGDSYFTKPPPDTGVRLTIAGRDNVHTQWEFDAGTAGRIAQTLRYCPLGVMVVAVTPYAPKEGPS